MRLAATFSSSANYSKSTMIDDGYSCKFDAANCLYILELEIEQPISLSARTEEVTWRWHARYEHLNFLTLQKLHKEEMVHDLLAIKGVNSLCDGCLIGKQGCIAFPF